MPFRSDTAAKNQIDLNVQFILAQEPILAEWMRATEEHCRNNPDLSSREREVAQAVNAYVLLLADPLRKISRDVDPKIIRDQTLPYTSALVAQTEDCKFWHEQKRSREEPSWDMGETAKKVHTTILHLFDPSTGEDFIQLTCEFPTIGQGGDISYTAKPTNMVVIDFPLS